MKMNKEQVKTGVWAAIVGAIIVIIIGFAWGGWVTGGTAREKANEAAEKAVVGQLAPICVVLFNQASEKDKKFKELKEQSSWARSGYLEKGGWATMPGSKSPVRGVADKCAKLILGE